MEEYGFAERIIQWIKAGGIWLAGPLTDIRNPHGAKYEKNPTGFIEELTGAYLKYAVPARNNADDVDGAISGAYAQPLIQSAAKIAWNINNYTETNAARLWADAYELPDNCQPLGAYTGGAFDALAAAFYAPIGNGGIIVLGTNPSEQALVELANFAFAKKGLTKGIETSTNVLAVERVFSDNKNAGVILLELGMKEGYAVLPRPMKNVMTGEAAEGRIELKPYSVLVFE